MDSIRTPPPELRLQGIPNRLSAQRGHRLATDAMYMHVVLGRQIAAKQYALAHSTKGDERVRLQCQLREMYQEQKDLGWVFGQRMGAYAEPGPELRPEPNVRSLESENLTREERKP